jgi:hypothetical protein
MLFCIFKLINFLLDDDDDDDDDDDINLRVGSVFRSNQIENLSSSSR